ELDETVIVPRTAAPSAGAVSAPLGEVLSRVTVRAALVVWLPATSVVTTRSWQAPSENELVTRSTWYGGEVTAWPRSEKPESLGPLIWNCAEATPDPPASEESDETVICPCTAAPSAGAVSEPVGAAESTFTC